MEGRCIQQSLKSGKNNYCFLVQLQQAHRVERWIQQSKFRLLSGMNFFDKVVTKITL
jgi:hypothetical protein